MFYNQAAIDELVSRLGWSQTVSPADFSITVQNTTSTSGRFFVRYSKYAIPENIFSTQPNFRITITDFDQYLFDLKTQAAMAVLSVIFDNNPRANYFENVWGCRIDTFDTDYSDIIISRSGNGLFDDVIGYQMAILVVELLLTTTRKNGIERDNKYTWEELKFELDGIVDHLGRMTSKGLYAKLDEAKRKVIDILFPRVSYPILVGRQPW